eukprot:SAG31_NODE_1974_length_6755_cov_6.833383_4_plen_140_part_00
MRRLAFAKLLHPRVAEGSPLDGAMEETEIIEMVGLLVIHSAIIFVGSSRVQCSDQGVLTVKPPLGQTWAAAVCVEQPMHSGVHTIAIELGPKEGAGTFVMVGCVPFSSSLLDAAKTTADDGGSPNESQLIPQSIPINPN